jgi:hypothetical protein
MTENKVSENKPPENNAAAPQIPISIIVIACLFFLAGAMGFAAHFHELFQKDGLWVAVTEALAIVCGVFLLRGQNWARWLAVAWIAFHVVIAALNGWREAVLHGFFLVAITVLLFRADASQFFRRPRTPIT